MRQDRLRDTLPLLCAFIALVAWDVGGLDLPLIRLYGNAQGFVWREHWLVAGLMHDGMRVLALGAFGLLAIAVWRPFSLARRLTRRERLWWLATTLLCATLVASLKRGSTTSCPWSLAEFGGGMAHYMPHWALGQHDGGPGGCFPSGHASIAFSLLAGGFVLRRTAPAAALGWLLLCTLAGIALGWVQMMRGAHYMSHALWTAWICWAVTTASFHATRAWRQGSSGPVDQGNDGAPVSYKS